MSPRSAVIALVAAMLGGSAHSVIIWQKHCQTQWQGQLVSGVVTIENDSYHNVHTVHGQLRDRQGTLIEFEIVTNQPQGVGGMWFNHARHRYTPIHWRMLPDGNGFVITAEGGASARYACR